MPVGGDSITVVSAGHPPPLLLRPDRVQELPLGGPMLGAVESPALKLHRVKVREGNQLVLYTDGVTEARGKRERFGEDRLRKRLMGTVDPAAAVARLESALDAFINGRGADDAAAVVVQRLPAGRLAARIQRRAKAHG